MAVLCAVSLVVLVLPVVPCLSASYTVGGSSGWTIPSEAGLSYERWAASHTYHVGDTLVFNYVKEAHTVLQVTRSNYRFCNATSPFATYNDGRTEVTLKQNGSYYFICGVPGHCQAGQKFQLKVVHKVDNGQGSQDDAMPAPSPSPESVHGGAAGLPPATAFSPSIPFICSPMLLALAAVVQFL